MRNVILCLIVGLGVLAQAQSPQELVQDAIQKQRSGQLEEAVTEYRQFLKLVPDAPAIHSDLGAALVGLGRYEEALPEYQIALRQSPKLAAARLNLALVYYKMGRISDATAELEKVHSEEPSNHQATLLLGDCYLRMGREKDVIRVLQPEESKDPNDLAMSYLLGTALIRTKHVKEGEVLVDKILRNGDSAEAHLMLGEAKMNVSDFAGARDEFALAVKLNPKLGDAHALYAKALMMTGDSDLSTEQFKDALTFEPYNFDANLQLGAAARQQDNYDEAESYLLRAQETRPNDPGVLYQLALVDIDKDKLEDARRILESLVKKWPEFTEAHVSLALAYYRLNRPDDGKHERQIVLKLTAEAQAKQPGVAHK
ncbi:MAG: tetratricopeptide repeat protein [Terracidiphilus sp.]